ncbi:cupin domain-containing protein [Prosthecobacter dejongeii]|uniref:Quercetin dioxygenase-like cupin family protein n=1 Tax=Prosthecobacter dejongeii TaxID=48465 RepID=A0A7W8DRZ1_9BACT|nr:cupin domain-containing protein [Prosthecobacter dejongeii]MBB5039351.1 quercetin dioxygenase-like cupin family protein [Prosthecobacter dejongeii]
MANKATIIPAGQGTIIRAFGQESHFHLTGEQTGGAYTQWVEITQPGGGPPPHFHTREDEWFYVLEGQMSFLKEGQWNEGGPGTAVYMPRNVPHAFKNTGNIVSKMLITTAPSGFENFFARCAEVMNQPGEPDMQRIIEISAEHGIYFVNP